MATHVSPTPMVRMAAPTGCRAGTVSRGVASRGAGAGARAGAGAVVGVGIGVRGGGMPAAICAAKFRPVAGRAGEAGALGTSHGTHRRSSSRGPCVATRPAKSSVLRSLLQDDGGDNAAREFAERPSAQGAAAAAAFPAGSNEQQSTSLSSFACPLCAGAMIRIKTLGEGGGPTVLRCGRNHAFDVSRGRVVNLLIASRGGGRRATGDTSEMLHARRRFLGEGHYQEVSSCVNDAVLACIADVARVTAAASPTYDDDGTTNNTLADDAVNSILQAQVEGEPEPEPEPAPEPAPARQDEELTPRQRRLAANKRKSKTVKAQAQLNRSLEKERQQQSHGGLGGFAGTHLPLVVDFGCGEGWWLEQVINAVAAANTNTATRVETPAARFAAFDASPDAARMAAKLLNATPSHVEVAVADAQWNALPFLDGSVAAALSVFAPRNPRELHRVVAAAGAVIVVSPGKSHLAELRAASQRRGDAEGVTVLEVHEGKQERTAGLMEAAGFVTSKETVVEGVMVRGEGFMYLYVFIPYLIPFSTP